LIPQAEDRIKGHQRQFYHTGERFLRVSLSPQHLPPLYIEGWEGF